MDKTLEAFARLADEYEDATLTIVGIGEMEAQLKARIAELRLQESVTLTGGLPHEEVLRRMARATCSFCPAGARDTALSTSRRWRRAASPSARKTRALPTPSRTARTAFLCPPARHGRGGSGHARCVRPSRSV